MIDINTAFDALEKGDIDEAERLCQVAIGENPTQPAPYYLLGTLHGLRDRVEEAIACLERARSFAPNHVATNVNLATLLKRADKPQQAFDVLKSLERTTTLDAEALALKANLQLELKDPRAAVESANLALAQDKDCISAMVSKANSLAALGFHDEALRLYSKAKALDQSPQLAINEARVLQDCGRVQQALDAYEHVLNSDPAQIEALTGKALVLCELDKSEEAVRTAQTALTLAPASREAKFMLASALRRADKNEEARPLLEELLQTKKEARMLVVYAQVLSDLFLHDAAIEACTQAIALSPVHHDAYLQRGLIRLLTGNFERGFEDYEHRLLARYNMRMTLQQTEKFVPFAHRNPEIEDVKDKRLLIMEEQGIGDVIMFSGLLPDLLQFTQTFEVVVQARLIALMRRSFPEVIFHPLEEFTQDGLKRFDRLIMFGSLPHIFRREKNRFKKSSYLKADPDKVALWQKTLRSATDTKLIGISWRGGTAGTHARRRSIDFSKFCAMIGEERHHLVSLQFGDEEDKDLTEVTRIPAQQKWDLDDLAALISALDEVVTVQNTNVHICGALGKACTVIIPNIPEWRYGLAGEMYWYTSPRVIWQKDILDQA